MARYMWLVLAGLTSLLVGCDVEALVNSAKAGKKQAAKSETDSSPAEEATPTKPVEMEEVVAEAGVGKKGQILKSEGVNQKIAQPVIILRQKEQEIAFGMLRKWLREYEAIHGKVPQTMEDFQKKIVKPSIVKLPELPEGHKYIWKPEEKELYVLRPKTK